MKTRDVVFEVLKEAGAQLRVGEIHQRVCARGEAIGQAAVYQQLRKHPGIVSPQKGWYALRDVDCAAPAQSTVTAVAEDIAPQASAGSEALERRWLETTEGVREEGVMPAEVAAILFGRHDPYAPPRPEPVRKANGLAPCASFEPSAPAPSLPAATSPRQRIAGSSRKLSALSWLLARINSQIASLKQLTGSTLEEVTVHPLDFERLRRLAQNGADGLSQFESLLSAAADFHAGGAQ